MTEVYIMAKAKDSETKSVKPRKNAPTRYKNVMHMQEGEYPFQAGEGDLGTRREKSKRINQNLGKYSLTEKQAVILKFITEHIQHVGFPPTVREIAIYFSISAKASHDHLRAIAKKGYLRLFPGSARGMELVKSDEDLTEENSPFSSGLADLSASTVIVPLVGSIAAGTPILAEENIEAKLSFPSTLLPTSGEMFALRVRGDSMEGAGIFDGDIAVIKKIKSPQTELQNGDIVAALLEEEATLKTFQKKRRNIELHPENPRYKIIPLNEKSFASIMGKLVGVYRTYR